ncbi:MAG TPA: hypothetical protein VNU19_07080 [Candidatus Acidoferrum sp.]|nr:hypothetical protein [Candidatus Acidoferrum sp.]
MALQFSTTLRNDMMSTNSAITEVWNTVLGATSTCIVLTGSPPATCATASTGTLLATFTLNASPFGVASSGAMILGGLTLSATASGGSASTPGYFRMLDNSGNCHVQGTCGISSGDLSFNGTITSAQTVQISGFTVTAPGA